ncbi:protein FAR1-RELATED SEQUENCE 5 [Citrus sinensis]|uniref:Protein FAR1-RELATED SEQUENCE 5 n=1 Tax=Citrus sinensis TaxID=2711 RepID=A0ACB8NZD6_CITSI|nr:protein FAR1-RELATED SEQUENCE 5 [Citrus sinensis]
MKNSNEEQEDRDDLEYPVTTEADIDGWWNVSSNDEGEAHNDESGSIKLQVDINSEMGTNQNQTDRQQCTERDENDVLAMPTMLGREFESEEQAETWRTWVCSREGFRAAKYLQKRSRQREPRPLTRSGCQAQFRIILNSETKRWSCNYFQAVHNHNLTPPQLVHHIRSHRTVTDPDLVMAASLQRVGVTPSQIHEFMVDRSGGYNRVGYNRVDVQNKLASNRKRQLKESDAETCLSYLEGKKSSDPLFFYDITMTSSNRLGDLFWCDGGSCTYYALFGDVIAFDATYKTNAYQKPFVVILGINHHRRSIEFGFALLLDETEHTYTWLLETFLTAMNNKQPKAREGEGKDNFDSCEGSLVLITHLKMYERQAAETYTRAMFRLVRDELEKEGLLTAVIGGRDVMSTTYFVRHFGVSGNEVKVVITKPTNTVCCCCKLFETIGIPCSHTFVVLKAENITEIPGSMILSRWTKDAKIMDHGSLETCSTISHYMTEEARVGLIFSSCRNLLRYAASSVGAYNVAITDIHNLTLRDQSWDSNNNENAADVVFQDIMQHGLDITLSSHVPSQHPHSRGTKMSMPYPNTHRGVPLGSLSDSLLEHIPTTIDSDTSIPTLNTSTSTGRFDSIATSFCAPTNYGDIRKR